MNQTSEYYRQLALKTRETRPFSPNNIYEISKKEQLEWLTKSELVTFLSKYFYNVKSSTKKSVLINKTWYTLNDFELIFTPKPFHYSKVL